MLADLCVGQVPAPEAERHWGIRDRPPGEAGVQRRVAIRLQLEGCRAGLVPDMADLDRCVQCEIYAKAPCKFASDRQAISPVTP